jgi:hypothetical protein
MPTCSLRPEAEVGPRVLLALDDDLYSALSALPAKRSACSAPR